MNWTDVLDILKYTIPSVVTMLASYLILKTLVKSDREKKELEIHAANFRDSLPIRLQAYERLALFLERISPTTLIARVNKPGMTARDMQLSLLANIRLEFEHNQAQQIYVSAKVWMIIVQTKEEVIAIINKVGAEMNDTSTGKDLSRAILEHLISYDQSMPTQKALDTLKTEVKKIF